MSKFSRLQKKLSRLGIKASYQDQIYQLQNNDAMASVLLPGTLRLEEKAVQQLLNFAAVHLPNHPAHVVKACATPDFHPGSIAPVGSIVASTENMVIPAAIGTDINCGMRLMTTGIAIDTAKANQTDLENKLAAALLHDQRNVPMTPQAFKALFDEGLSACFEHLPDDGLWQQVNMQRLQNELAAIIGINNVRASTRYAPEAFLEDREIIRPASLGTVGSGNHFVELQVVDQISDRHLAYQHGLREGEVVIMMHTGSRDVGFYIGQRWMDKAKAAWPIGVKHPASGLYGLVDEQAHDYMQAMGVAVRYAWMNRIVLTEMIRQAWQTVFKEDQTKLIVDVPHNIIFNEQGMNIHRKGATPTYQDMLALIPGSMGDYSYLVSGLGNPDWLWSCSHGAGRQERRQTMRSKAPQEVTAEQLPWHCVTLNESRKIEEAPTAYKPITPVIEAQEQAQMIQSAVRLRPWITFKV